MLCRTLGRTPRELVATLSRDEFLEFEADYAIHPWGEEAADARHGIACSLLDACHRTKGEPAAPGDYFPYRAPRVKAAKNEALMKAIFDQAALDWGN